MLNIFFLHAQLRLREKEDRETRFDGAKGTLLSQTRVIFLRPCTAIAAGSDYLLRLSWRNVTL